MNPERGRKQPIRENFSGDLLNISEHEPRKGTETARGTRATYLIVKVFQNMNPERGRKRIRPVFVWGFVFFISEHEPRKGTETQSISLLINMVLPISEHEPRKGTETSCNASFASSV